MTAFLYSRMDYLKHLPSISSGWIGGGRVVEGVAPSKQACAHALAVLKALCRLPNNQQWNARTLLLGPLVTGGVAVELRHDKASILLDLRDTELSELCIMSGEGVSSWNESSEELVARLTGYLRGELLAPSHSSQPT
jgi:hypothetical protein